MKACFQGAFIISKGIKRKDITMNQNHIVVEPAGLIRKIARDALKGRWKEITIAVFIFAIMTDYIATILNTLFPVFREFDYMGQTLTINESFAGALYTSILTGAFYYGMALFMLTFFRTKKINNKLLFEGFSIPGKTILLQIIISIKIALWALLFIIPGILAAIRYSQAFYILADHPEYTVTQCIEESKARMNGNKAAFFGMKISFIGWYLIASICAQGLSMPFGTGVVSSLVGSLLGAIPMAVLAAYVKTADTVFYELLTQNLVVMVPDSEVQAQGVNPGNMINASYEVHEEPAGDVNIQEEAYSDQADEGAEYVVTPDEVITPVEEAADFEDPEIIVEEEVIVEPENVTVKESPARTEDEIDAFGGPVKEEDDL